MNRTRGGMFLQNGGMSTGVRPWFWRNETDNLSATVSASTPGTNFTAGANNADGAAVTLLSALTHDVHRIVLEVYNCSLSTADGNALGDLLIDPAGGTTWTSIIDDLQVGFTPVTAGTGGALVYEFPLKIASGASVGFRARCAHTVDITTGRMIAHVYGNPSRPEAWWFGTGVETLGATPTTSKGTDVTPGNTSAFGAWTTIGASTRHFGAVQLGGGGLGATTTALGYHYQIGFGSVQLIGSPMWHGTAGAAESVYRHGWGQMVRCEVPAGTTWQARAACSGVAEVNNLTIHGVYK